MPSFAVALIRPTVIDGPFEVLIRRDPFGRAGRAAGRTVWSEAFVDETAATARRDWLASDVDRLDYLGWLAAIVGPGLAMSEMLGFWRTELERQADERRREERERAEIEREEEEAREITAYCRSIGARKQPAIVLLRPCDAAPLLTMVFDEKWERERVWDWLRWQTGSFEDWRLRTIDVGEGAMERELLEEMLRTETRVKKAGLGAGGRRPLRFWRGDAS